MGKALQLVGGMPFTNRRKGRNEETDRPVPKEEVLSKTILSFEGNRVKHNENG